MDRKPYKVLRPIAFDGTRNVGEIVHLTDEEAARIGGEYVAPESVPVTTGESESVPEKNENAQSDEKVEDETAVKPDSSVEASH